MSKTTLTLQVLTNSTISASRTGTLLDKEQLDFFTFQSVWSGGGTPVGNVQIFGSNDPANLPNVGTTTAIINGTQIGSDVALSGNSGSNFVPVPSTAIAAIQSYRFVQYKFSFTSGTATLNVYFHGQGSA